MRPFVLGLRAAATLAVAAVAVPSLMIISPVGAQVDGDADAAPVAPADDLPEAPVDPDLPDAELPDAELPAAPAPAPEIPSTPELPVDPAGPADPPVPPRPSDDLGPFVPDRLFSSQPAPNCVDTFFLDYFTHKEVHLHNQCDGRIRVKVLVAFGPDSQCYNLLRGETQTYRWFVGWPFLASRFDALVHC